MISKTLVMAGIRLVYYLQPILVPVLVVWGGIVMIIVGIRVGMVVMVQVFIHTYGVYKL